MNKIPTDYTKMTGKQFGQVAEIAYWIEDRLKYAGIFVLQAKEKFGEVRVYCAWGIHWHKYKESLNFWPIPQAQGLWYRIVYYRALKKWPEYKEHILGGMDRWDHAKKLDPKWYEENVEEVK